jgi:bifunctional UDP-N-acetylglucosamine pyrophosphorylase / glucosamine-1-phosphate N-acetyltransferase
MAMSVILAAGKGTRMRSEVPKVLHRLMGAPLLEYALEKVEVLGCDPKVVVVGFRRDLVEAEFPGRGIRWAHQAEQLGTGHAAATGIRAVPDYDGDVLVLNGDLPLLEVETLRGMLQHHAGTRADVTVLTSPMANPYGYGRIIRDPATRLLRDIVEEKDADDATRAIPEGNVGTYVFRPKVFEEAYRRTDRNNRQGEYYLTDVVVQAVRAGARVETFTVPDGVWKDQVNSRREMASVAAVVRRRLLDAYMDSGVTIDDPSTTYIEKGVRIGRDTRIFPFVHIERGVEIGEGSEVGPFVHLRPGTVLDEAASIGNFVEIKASRVGPGVKARHLSYIGDAQVGADVNIGAGTIFANFDGKKKNATVVKRRAFIGSGTILVAPVTVGEGAITGAGAVVTKNHDVADGDVVVGIPAKSLRRDATGTPAEKKKST